MAFNKAGSKQIQDGAILSQHIGSKVVTDAHLADGAVKDIHIDIDWASKASAILATKKVVDYVQISPVSSATGETSVNVAGSIALPEAATNDDLGVIVSAPNNKVVLLEKNDGSKLLTDGATGNVIFGRMTTGFAVQFYTLVNGVETAYTFGADTEYQLQYPARFTLDTVSEMFASNEKFVDGAIDVTTRLDVAQVVADVFGDTYVLNKDGQGTAGQTIVELISAVETSVNTNTGDIAAIELILSGTEGNPESGLLTKVANAEGKITTVEGEVATLKTGVSTLQSEVETLKTTAGSPDLTAEVTALTEEVADLTTGATALETEVNALKGTVSSVESTVNGYSLDIASIQTEVANALSDLEQTSNNLESTVNGFSLDVVSLQTDVATLKGYDVDTRLSLIEDLVDGGNISVGEVTSVRPYRFDKKADTEVTEYVLVDLGIQADTLPEYNTVDVYINGMLQMAGEHYSEEDTDGNTSKIVFAPNVIHVGDIVQLRWTR